MKRILLAILVLLIVGVGVIYYLGVREPDSGAAASAAALTGQEQIARGKYLAQAGDCMACHTVRGGAPFAGGRAIQTPFGAIYASNITPDNDTGIGSWSADDFWRALHHGKSKDGKLLYPAFPYTNFTKVTRADSDAMHAYFRTVPAVRQENKEPELRFPFNHRILLAGWRALYFRPGTYEAEPGQSAEWNRGAYLVQGLGHCAACHTARNILGASESRGDLSGAMIPMLNWYAPPLNSETEAGLGNWQMTDLTHLLKTGVSMRGVVSGPMAEVVLHSLQHLSDDDVQSMALYLKSVPQAAKPSHETTPPSNGPENDRILKAGAALYEKHCVECHKANGEGVPPHYPSLAGNRGVLLDQAVNPIRMTLYGGYPPSTQGNPRPYGMPPFSVVLDDQEIAAVVSYIRNSWGNRGSMVSSQQVNRYRTVPLD
ncbi:MAG: c-type cytochrome [Noviherbaspirillum sp.]|nr:c-type cytochrome [Noviherbaspirillum sp.]